MGPKSPPGAAGAGEPNAGGAVLVAVPKEGGLGTEELKRLVPGAGAEAPKVEVPKVVVGGVAAVEPKVVPKEEAALELPAPKAEVVEGAPPKMPVDGVVEVEPKALEVPKGVVVGVEEPKAAVEVPAAVFGGEPKVVGAVPKAPVPAEAGAAAPKVPNPGAVVGVGEPKALVPAGGAAEPKGAEGAAAGGDPKAGVVEGVDPKGVEAAVEPKPDDAPNILFSLVSIEGQSLKSELSRKMADS